MLRLQGMIPQKHRHFRVDVTFTRQSGIGHDLHLCGTVDGGVTGHWKGESVERQAKSGTEQGVKR